jgi:hypothetical protein
MTNVDEAIVEIEAALEVILPQQEGMSDYLSLDLKDDTRKYVETTIGRYSQRVDLLTLALRSLKDLVADGYPELATTEIPRPAYDDLQENANTIEAALATFAPVDLAAGLNAKNVETLPK